jgi:hypothetical protein
MNLATEVFQALEVCLQQQPQQHSVSVMSIRSQLRSHLSADHMSRLIDLGTSAREFLKRVRRPLSPHTGDDSTNKLTEFTREERMLWYAFQSDFYILCLVNVSWVLCFSHLRSIFFFEGTLTLTFVFLLDVVKPVTRSKDQ